MYRLVVQLLDPYLVVMLLVGIALGSLWYRRREAWRRLVAATAFYFVLYCLSMPAVSHLFRGSLEWRYPPNAERADGVQAIVVLGGSMLPPDAVRTRAELGPSTMRRCVAAAELYRKEEPKMVIISGGKISSDDTGPTLAAAASEFLISLGVDKESIVLEDRSRTTAENAEFSCQLLHEFKIERFALVTDATHLWRAELCFRHWAEGSEIVPVGAAYRATQFEWQASSFLPSARAAADVGESLHEWLGVAWYCIRGKI